MVVPDFEIIITEPFPAALINTVTVRILWRHSLYYVVVWRHGQRKEQKACYKYWNYRSQTVI